MTRIDEPAALPRPGDVTRILSDLHAGGDQATDELLPLVYEELRRLAAAKMVREQRQHTLHPTALVHEAYLRLVKNVDGGRWENRRHFFGAAAEAMRRILVEHARAKARLKRRPPEGAAAGRSADVVLPTDNPEELLALDDALDRLAADDPDKAQLVKLKFFAGLTTPEAAEAMGLSLRTAERQWAFARAWLYREIEGRGARGPGEAST